MLAAIERAPVAPGHLGRHALDRLVAQEHDSAAEAHLAGCPSCRARLADLDAERRAFLVGRPASALVAAVEARAPKRPVWAVWPSKMTLGIGLAVAAAAVVMLLQRPGVTPAFDSPDTRMKAATGLSFHVRSGDAVRVGTSGETVHPGDAIQLRYSTARPAHLVVVSMDNAGAVTAFYDDRGRSIGVAPGVAELLEGSVVLDDALGPERVVGCFSDAPLDTRAVLDAGRRALTAAGGDPRGVQRLDLDCDQVTFVLNKSPPAERQ